MLVLLLALLEQLDVQKNESISFLKDITMRLANFIVLVICFAILFSLGYLQFPLIAFSVAGAFFLIDRLLKNYKAG